MHEPVATLRSARAPLAYSSATRARRLLLAGLAIATSTAAAFAQTAPQPAIRRAEVRRHAITNATIVTEPGRVLENATIVLEDGVITAVGQRVQLPAGCTIHDGEGRFIYPAFIEPSLQVASRDASDAAASQPGAHWNGRITPQVDVAALEVSGSTRESLRALGFATAMVLPADGILRGHGRLMLLAEDDEDAVGLAGTRPMAAGFSYGGGWQSATYPGSLMGAIALLRQTMLDARWHAEARRVWETHPENNEPPIDADALAALTSVVTGDTVVVFDAGSELDALRAARIAEEFDLELVIVGGGNEFRRIDEILATNAPLIVPVSFPKTPEVTNPYAADAVSLRDLLTWKHAPENASRLVRSGATVALTTHRLEKKSTFHDNVRRAIEGGLEPDEALAALTTIPAKLYGVESSVGTIAAGKLANLIVADGPLFEKDTELTAVWVAGREHDLEKTDRFGFSGTGTLVMEGVPAHEVEIDAGKKSFTIHNADARDDDDDDDSDGDGDGDRDTSDEADADADGDDADAPEDAPSKWRARSTQGGADSLNGVVDGEAFGAIGPVRVGMIVVDGVVHGVADFVDGTRRRFRVEPMDEDPDDDNDESDDGEADDAKPIGGAVSHVDLPLPLGAHGLMEPGEAETVLIRGATIWTMTDDGILEDADILLRDGKIAAIGRNVAPPSNAIEIDGAGLHVTPGLIDCHSHTGINGGVNEWTQNDTAEVRIGDVVNPDDINWYRQLAGGLTAANQLHGSANPIGGQNSVVKLRWGGTVDDMRIENAIGGIKFALGENVVRSEGRYPDTRMGVAAFLDDSFRAASEYRDARARYDALPARERARTMPPRPDLELDALVEILEGDRIVHCHSYRQDEILMLLRIAERWGFTIGTLQHILEGFKVAEAIAEHGAGASSFSDWWAYKMEVMDAIPDNGAIMHEVGVLVSFNSDSNELARRMNQEAAKAVRFGGMDPHEALKFVTLNPAKQLRIDDRTGSLEVGKDADVAIWNGDPLSTFTRCEMTFVEGVRCFDRERDQSEHEIAMRRRAELMAEAVTDEDDREWMNSTEEPMRPGGNDGVRPTRGSLIARMLDESDRELMEMVRRGVDPEDVRPGECGCASGNRILDMLRGEMNR